MSILSVLLRYIFCIILFFGSLHTFSQESRQGTFYTVEKMYPDSRLDGYNLYLPPSYDADSSDFPVIVFLQGGLGVGGEVDIIFNWALPRILKETQTLTTDLDRMRMNTFVYVMPHIQKGQFYENVPAISQMLDELISTYRIDPRRIYLTGLSRGGHGTWGVASKMPERFAAIVPICGDQQGVTDYQSLAELPIWAAHNPKDNIVKYDYTQSAVAKIEALSKTNFHQSKSIAAADWENHKRIFTSSSNPKKPHDAWTEVYNDMGFYRWLLRFQKE
ncbi:MAG: prolyl oligopeptidase family serine peptidase [Bacteroidota bacterium]